MESDSAFRQLCQQRRISATGGNGCQAGFRIQVAGVELGDGPIGRFFGNGVSLAVGKGKDNLREALDYELDKLMRDGTYADLYLKYFPIGFY